MAIYYIDSENGKKDNSGLSPKSPKNDERDCDVCPGDKVLFKCGSIMRRRIYNVCGEPGKPVTYGSYGSGAKPTFYGSVDVSNPDLWYETEPNIWVTEAVQGDEACNIIFNSEFLVHEEFPESCGTLRWALDDLSEQGDFWDESFGTWKQGATHYPPHHKIYLWSECNPGEYYRHIEIAVYGTRVLVTSGHDLIIRDLHFTHAGVHAIASGDGHRMTVKNCLFTKIGGCVWDKNAQIRFGNGVEFWNECEDVTVTGCLFDDIYDSGVTHQGRGDRCKPAVRFICKSNFFYRCGMAAYEIRDRFPVDSEFSKNTCTGAGEGFSKNGVTMPRKSEIWPEPMGHHIFAWRINATTDGGTLLVKGNSFGKAPYGCAIYSAIAPEAEAQMTLKNNKYTDCEPIIHSAKIEEPTK